MSAVDRPLAPLQELRETAKSLLTPLAPVKIQKRRKKQDFSGLAEPAKKSAIKVNNRLAAQSLRDRKKHYEHELEERLRMLEESNRQLNGHLASLQEENRQIADEARRFTDEQIEKFQLHGFVARLSAAVRKDTGDGVQLSQLLTSLGVALPTSYSPPTSAAMSPAPTPVSDTRELCCATEESSDDGVATQSGTSEIDPSLDGLFNTDLAIMDLDTTGLLDDDALSFADSVLMSTPTPSQPAVAPSSFSSSPLSFSQPSPMSLPPALSPSTFTPSLSPAVPSDAVVPARPSPCEAEGAKVCESAVLSPLPSGLSFLLLFILSAMQFRISNDPISPAKILALLANFVPSTMNSALPSIAQTPYSATSSGRPPTAPLSPPGRLPPPPAVRHPPELQRDWRLPRSPPSSRCAPGMQCPPGMRCGPVRGPQSAACSVVPCC